MNASTEQSPAHNSSTADQNPMKAACPLFVVGVPRSGTTAFSKLLNAHPRILLTNESAIVLQMGEMIRRSRIGVTEGILFGKSHNELWADQLQESMRTLTEQFYAKVADAEGKVISDGPDSIAYYGDKHPHLKDCIDSLKPAFPDARFIHLIRDPRDSALSIAQMQGTDFRSALLNWKRFDSRYNELIQDLNPDLVYTVRYEDLVEDYRGCIASVLDWLGLDMESQIEDHIDRYSNIDAHTYSSTLPMTDTKSRGTDSNEENQFFKNSVGRWKRELDNDQLAIADELVGDDLERYGYEFSIDNGSNRPAPKKPIRAIVNPVVGQIKFQCNICGKRNEVDGSKIGRETSSCSGCRSTVRMRSIIHLLSMELFGESMLISDMPPRPEIRGIGMSDWGVYAKRLANVFSYTNTFYDHEPQLDVTNPDPALFGTYDFIISSDVYEHVAPPVSIAFENAKKLLKPGGVMIFSVPFTLGETVEHFPDLHDYEIVGKGASSVLINTTKTGVKQEFRNLVFHGGEGATLEMRVYGREPLIKHFEDAGFETPTVYQDPHQEFGIYFPQNWSLPMIARVPE
tara:strand:+ start:223106 stop:224818 length:1713 start_codon:yes stop_codon:yes gene_type:complete